MNTEESLTHVLCRGLAWVRHFPKRVVLKSCKILRFRQVRRFERRYLDGLKNGFNDAGGKGIIVSLTSYGARMETVHLAILSILDQTISADKVVLYLDKNINLDDLPDSLARLQGPQFEIRGGYLDVKPHKKYLYAMREFPDACIVTIDDDMVYPRDTLEVLVRGHERFPDCVIARRVHMMETAEDGSLKPYVQWPFEYQLHPNAPSCDLFATGGAGALYPPHCLSSDAFKEDAIVEYCFSADDVWLKCAQIAAGTKVVYVPNSLNLPFKIEGSQEQALCNANVAGGENDAQLAAAMGYFGLTPADFFEGEEPRS